ncbi:MAG: hypothetical protein R6X21_09510, partial [Candidatus Aminicenantes bacterium]
GRKVYDTVLGPGLTDDGPVDVEGPCFGERKADGRGIDEGTGAFRSATGKEKRADPRQENRLELVHGLAGII